MARGRMLNASISVSAQVADLDNDTHRLVFTWALAHLDRDGRLDGNPRTFKGRVCPLLDHLSSVDIALALVDIVERRLAVAYLDGTEQRALFFPGFAKGQSGMKPDREAESKFSAPASPVGALLGAVPDWLRDEARTSPSEEKGMEQKGNQKKAAARAASEPGGSGSSGVAHGHDHPRTDDEPAPIVQPLLALAPLSPPEPSPVETVFAGYVAGAREKGKRTPILTDARRKLIRARLRDFSPEMLAYAARGIWLSGWNVEQGRTDLELALRDAGHIERFAALGERGVLVTDRGRGGPVQRNGPIGGWTEADAAAAQRRIGAEAAAARVAEGTDVDDYAELAGGTP